MGGGSEAFFDLRQQFHGDGVDGIGTLPAGPSRYASARRMVLEPALQGIFRGRTGAISQLDPRVPQTVERLGHLRRTFRHRQSRCLGGYFFCVERALPCEGTVPVRDDRAGQADNQRARANSRDPPVDNFGFPGQLHTQHGKIRARRHGRGAGSRAWLRFGGADEVSLRLSGPERRIGNAKSRRRRRTGDSRLTQGAD